MLQLNLIIFKEVALHLSFKSFKLILEYSLLSKSCFKFFQNLLVSHDFYKLNRFIITTTQLTKYLTQPQNNDNNDNNNDNNFKDKFVIKINQVSNFIKNNIINNSVDKYQFKLIQYKEIERIKCEYIQKHKPIQVNQDNLVQFKELLVKHCPKLKQVIFINQVKSVFRTSFDYTADGFFKYKKLLTVWTFQVSCGPLSEYGDESYVEYDDDDDDDDDIFNYVQSYPYSFQFINNYNPSNLIIKTTPSNYYKINFTNINNILYSTSSPSPIKRINFKFHNTPINFLRLACSNEYKIKSLKVRISNIPNVINCQFESLLCGNNTLKVLLFRNPLKTSRDLVADSQNNINLYDRDNNAESDLISLLNILKNSGNKSITTLGLESFIIKSSKSLSTILSIPQITWLHCNFDSIDAIVDHLKLNQNIKYLTISRNDSDNHYLDRKNDINVNYSLQQLVDNKSLSLQIKK